MAGRVYRDPVTGVRLPSVTTILSEMNVPALMFWAARLAAETGDPYAHNGVKERGGALGTLVHHAINTGDFTQVPAGYAEALDMFFADHPFEFLSQEQEVISTSERYGGTYDAVIRLLDSGLVLMIDAKTNASGIKEARARLQLAGYRYADNAPPTDGAAILHLRPYKYEFREVDAGIPEWEAFLNYRDIHEWRRANDR